MLAQRKSLRAHNAVRHRGSDQQEAGDCHPVSENSREFSAQARSKPLKQSPLGSDRLRQRCSIKTPAAIGMSLPGLSKHEAAL